MWVLAWIAMMWLAFAAPAGAQDVRWPNAAPENWALVHIDVETTGLDPAWHEMIDMGVIYTDLEGREMGRIYLRIMPGHPERLDPGAKAVNGFELDYWSKNGAVSEAEAVRQFKAYHQSILGARQGLLTAYNSWFDHAFLCALLKEHGAVWRELFHYHVLDVPSMAMGQGIDGVTGREVARALGLAPETSVPLDHTGMTGAEFNVAVYRALRARAK